MQILSQLVLYAQAFLLAALPMNTFTEGVVGQPRSFFPNQTVTQNDKTISSLLFRGLFKYDNFGSLVPDLADSWVISGDEMVYTIKLKPGQTWSDGSPIVADDLIYTAYKVTELAGVATDKIDDLTVRYTLPNRFSPFISMLTIGVMQSNSQESYDPLNPVTSGPFRIARVDKAGPIVKDVILYDTQDKQDISRLQFRYYEAEDQVITAAQLGEIDGFVSIKKHELPNFENHRFPLQSVYYALFFNLRNEKFKDIAFREKLAKVLPIQSIIGDAGIEVQGPISRSFYTNRDATTPKFDKTFKEKMTELELTITVPYVKQQVAVAEQVKNFWEDQLDIKVNIQKADSDNFYEKIVKDRNFEVLLYGQEIGRDPDRYTYWHSTQQDAPGLNISGFSQVRADRALEEGRKETDPEGRVVHYNVFQKVISEQNPAVFLYHPYYNYYVSKFVTGMGDKYTFELKDRFLDLPNWKIVSTN